MPYHTPAPGPAPMPEPFRKGPWIFFPDNAEYYPAVFRAEDVTGIEVEHIKDDDADEEDKGFSRVRVAMRYNDEVYYGPVAWFPRVVELVTDTGSNSES